MVSARCHEPPRPAGRGRQRADMSASSEPFPVSPAASRPRRLVSLVVTAGALAAAFFGVMTWRNARLAAAVSSYAPPPVDVASFVVKAAALPQTIEAIGTLVAVREVTLAPEIAGRIVAIRFEAGADVAAGAPLVELYDAPERADRAAAAARAQFARLQLDRSRQLEPRGAESRQILDQRVAEVAQAEASVQQIDARIAQRSITAPFAGRLGLRRVNLGQYVNAGEPIATLTALDRLHVNFTVPQQDLARLSVGGRVFVRTDAYPSFTFEARINAVEPVVGSDTRNVTVQATLDNPDGMLRPGLYVTAHVELPPRPDAILVPATAAVTSASGDSAYLIRDGKAAVVPVTIGRRVGNDVVVEHGLSPGDVVITMGQLRVQPGAPVTTGGAAAPRR